MSKKKEPVPGLFKSRAPSNMTVKAMFAKAKMSQQADQSPIIIPDQDENVDLQVMMKPTAPPISNLMCLELLSPEHSPMMNMNLSLPTSPFSDENEKEKIASLTLDDDDETSSGKNSNENINLNLTTSDTRKTISESTILEMNSSSPTTKRKAESQKTR